MFEPKRHTAEGYQKSQKILDVYRFNEAVYAANQENIESLNKSFEESESVALLEADSTFDWQFLNDWLAKNILQVLMIQSSNKSTCIISFTVSMN